MRPTTTLQPLDLEVRSPRRMRLLFMALIALTVIALVVTFA